MRCILPAPALWHLGKHLHCSRLLRIFDFVIYTVHASAVQTEQVHLHCSRLLRNLDFVHIYCCASAVQTEQVHLHCSRLLRIFVADNRIRYMSRKKRPSSRRHERPGKNRTPEEKAVQKEISQKKKDRGGSRKKSKGKKERFNKEELTGTVSMTREGYGFVEVPDRDTRGGAGQGHRYIRTSAQDARSSQW